MTDVCIVGGGLVGSILAIALAKKGLSSTLIDLESKKIPLTPEKDGRTTAVNFASKVFFDRLGLWSELSPHAEPILNIKIFEGGTPWAIHFNHNMVGSQPMGYIVENCILRQAILKIASSLPLITWYDGVSLLDKNRSQTGINLHLSNGITLKTGVLVAADGRNSAIRTEMGMKTHSFSYHQKSLVFSVYHEKPHENSAWEIFYPQGPMAFLPRTKCPLTHRYRSGVVWVLPEKEADLLFLQSNEEIQSKLQTLFGFLGNLEVIDKKWIYPLEAQVVRRFIDHRVVIIGDAAHVYHPVAGQGVNLGWRDAAILCDHFKKAKQLGIDLGGQTLLKAYERERKLDSLSMFALTHGVVRLFSNRSSLLYCLRTAGLGVINRISPLKQFFIQRAMGIF